VIAVLRGELPTPPSRTVAYSGPVDDASLSALAEGLASNMLVHGLRLDGAPRDPSSAAVLRGALIVQSHNRPHEQQDNNDASVRCNRCVRAHSSNCNIVLH